MIDDLVEGTKADLKKVKKRE